MRARSARVRVIAHLLVVVGVLGIGVVWLPSSATAAGAPQSSTIVVRLVPRGPLITGSTVDVFATVSPASAVGQVVFTINNPGGTGFTQRVAAGGARVGPLAFSLPGEQRIQARFVPDDPRVFAASTSSVLVLQVVGDPRVAVLNASGQALTAGSTVQPRALLSAALTGFPPSVRVTLLWDRTGLTTRATTDARGNAVVGFRVPSRLRLGTHRVTARSGQVSAVTFVSTVNQATTVRTSIPPPRRRHGGGDDGGEGGGSGVIPKTGGSHSSSSLPKTGAEVGRLGLAAALLLIVGGALVWAAGPRGDVRPMRSVGRHQAVR